MGCQFRDLNRRRSRGRVRIHATSDEWPVSKHVHVLSEDRVFVSTGGEETPSVPGRLWWW